MDETAHSAIADAPLNFNALIASLRAAGAERFDAVRLYHIDVLARRAAAHQGSVRHMLDAKLAHALAVFKERFDQAQCEAREIIAQTMPRYPHAAKDLQRLFAAGDFKGLQQLIAALKTREQGASLGALVRELEQHSPENAHGLSELKVMRDFRSTWSRLSTDRQVARALKQAPTNAGPINSHMLVLRSLALMRDISPDYLNRFMSYTDTLLCLDQYNKEKPGNSKKQVPKAAKKS